MTTTATAKHLEWGREAEQIAAEYLRSKGYVVREQNWSPRNSHLEVDIIAQHQDEIVFVEVKARKNRYTDPADAITPDKIRKLVRAANSYLNTLELDFSYRFDVVTISGTADDYVLDHIEDAFLPPLTGGR
jgi:putative endonuclease